MVAALIAILLFFLVVALFFRRQGYFFSRYSLVLRANFPLLIQHPEIILEPLLVYLPPNRRIQNLASNITRMLLYGVGVMVIFVIIMFIDEAIAFDGIIGVFQLSHQIWQVHATIAGFSIVALTFYWEALSSKITVPEAIGHLVNDTEVLGTVYTLLISNIVIGIAAWYSEMWLPNRPNDPFGNVGGVEVLTVGLCVGAFLLSMIAVMSFFESLYRILFKIGVEQAVLDSFSSEMDSILSKNPEPTYGQIIDRVSSVESQTYLFGFSWEDQAVTAEDLSLSGETLTDVHLKKLENAISTLEPDEDVVISLRPGQQFRPNSRLIRFGSTTGGIDDFKEEFKEALNTES